MKKLLAIASVLLLANVAGAQTTTITFDAVDTLRFQAGDYTEGGMLFLDVDEFQAQIRPDSGSIPSNGTTILQVCGVCRPSLVAEDGGLFDLVAVDLGEFLNYGYGPFPTAVRVFAVKEDDSIVQLDLTTDGNVGLERISFGEDLTNLKAVTFTMALLFSNIAIDNIEVRTRLERPALRISPPSGLYVTTQAFDLTLIVPAVSGGTVQAATLDGVDFSAELAACAIDGELDNVPGTSLRCSLELDEGEHTFEASFELPSGSTTSDAVTWEVLGTSEP